MILCNRWVLSNGLNLFSVKAKQQLACMIRLILSPQNLSPSSVLEKNESVRFTQDSRRG